MGFGDNIKRIRIERGIKQTELSDKISKSVRMLQKYESNEVMPAFEVLQRIADALEVPILEILDVNEDNDYLHDVLGTPKNIKEMENSLSANNKIIQHRILDLIDTIIKQDNDFYLKYHKFYGEIPGQILNTTYSQDISNTIYHLVELGIYDLVTSNIRTLIKVANQKIFIDSLMNKEDK